MSKLGFDWRFTGSFLGVFPLNIEIFEVLANLGKQLALSLVPHLLYAMNDPLPTQATNDVVACDVTRKFIRVKEVRPNGLVIFDFSIGWPEMAVELVMPQAAFDEFCVANQVQRLTD